MSCVNWNGRYIQDLLPTGQHHDLQSKHNIAELHVSFNFVAEVPRGALEGFHSLTLLSLTCNCLVSIPAELGYVPTLCELHLSNNQIRAIENLEALVNLRILNLRCNRIRCIGNLKTNVSLERLTLSNNEIEAVDWDHLPELTHLTFLGLYCNQLQFSDVLRLVSKAPLLSEAFLGGNPFSSGLPLTVNSAVMRSSGHLDGFKDCNFVSLVRKGLHGGNVLEAMDVASSLFHGESNLKALQRLVSVVNQLRQLRDASPAIVKVDGERLVP